MLDHSDDCKRGGIGHCGKCDWLQKTKGTEARKRSEGAARSRARKAAQAKKPQAQ